MKVKITSTKAFKIETEDGINLGTFMVDSEWCGMTKFQANNGQFVIVSQNCSTDFLLNKIFGTDTPQTLEVVKMSQTLVDKVKDEPTDTK